MRPVKGVKNIRKQYFTLNFSNTQNGVMCFLDKKKQLPGDEFDISVWKPLDTKGKPINQDEPLIYNHYSGTAPCVTLCSIVRRTWCRLSLDQHIAFCLFHADYWEYRAVDWYLLVIQNIIRDWGDSIQSWSCPTNGLTQSLYCDGNKERKYGV